jgi:AraC-like DNA-binding protein
MTRGFQVDELAEHAAGLELAAAVRAWHDAENNVRQTAQAWLDRGCRSHVIAAHLGMSRSTLHRILTSDFR